MWEVQTHLWDSKTWTTISKHQYLTSCEWDTKAFTTFLQIGPLKLKQIILENYSWLLSRIPQSCNTNTLWGLATIPMDSVWIPTQSVSIWRCGNKTQQSTADGRQIKWKSRMNEWRDITVLGTRGRWMGWWEWKKMLISSISGRIWIVPESRMILLVISLKLATDGSFSRTVYLNFQGPGILDCRSGQTPSKRISIWSVFNFLTDWTFNTKSLFLNLKLTNT